MNKFLGLNFNKSEIIKLDSNSFSFIIGKYLEPHKRYLRVIYVGANRGRFYDDLTAIYSESKICALLIEPIPECVKILEAKYNYTNLVTICNKALSDRIESKDFFIYQYDETSSLLKIKNDLKELKDIKTDPIKSIKLVTDTLDNIVQRSPFLNERNDILKIDVQGFEDKVLKGASKTLINTKYVWVEVSFKALYNGTCLFSDIHNILTESGFILLEIADGHRSSENELLQANCLFMNNTIV